MLQNLESENSPVPAKTLILEKILIPDFLLYKLVYQIRNRSFLWNQKIFRFQKKTGFQKNSHNFNAKGEGPAETRLLLRVLRLDNCFLLLDYQRILDEAAKRGGPGNSFSAKKPCGSGSRRLFLT